MNRDTSTKSSSVNPMLSWVRRSTNNNENQVNFTNHNGTDVIPYPYHYPYIEYRSLADALSAVANAQSSQIVKDVEETETPSPISLISEENLRPKGRGRSLQEVYTSTNSENGKSSCASSPSLEVCADSSDKPLSDSSDLHLTYLDSKSSSALETKTKASSTNIIRRNLTQLKSVIVRDAPSDYHNLVPKINSVQLLQEKIFLATTRAEKFLERKSSKSISAKEYEKNVAQRKKSLKGMAYLRELLNEPFIPEGYELSGKHLQLASSAITNIHELLNTDLFKNIERRPTENGTEKARVTWAPMPILTKTVPITFYDYDTLSISTLSTSASASSAMDVKKKIAKHGIVPSKANYPDHYLRYQWPFQPKSHISKKAPAKNTQKPTYNSVMTNAERGKKDAEKGLVGIEIDEFDPSSCFFYRDDRGNYNAHKVHFKGLKDEMQETKKKWNNNP